MSDHESIYLTPDELAERWRCTRGHLANMRQVSQGPAYLRVNNGRVLYDRQAIEQYERDHVVEPLAATEGRR